MREHKFRGKRPFNGEWVYGFLMDWEGKRPSIFVQNGDVDEETGDVDYIDYTVDPETVGQYTGLPDKNGKEGYESDILATPVGRVAIRFGEYSSPSGIEKHIGFYIEFTDGDYADLYRKDIGYWMPQSVIIGTVWDNPELLKEDE